MKIVITWYSVKYISLTGMLMINIITKKNQIHKFNRNVDDKYHNKKKLITNSKNIIKLLSEEYINIFIRYRWNNK
jgi:hypothetical protein